MANQIQDKGRMIPNTTAKTKYKCLPLRHGCFVIIENKQTPSPTWWHATLTRNIGFSQRFFRGRRQNDAALDAFHVPLSIQIRKSNRRYCHPYSSPSRPNWKVRSVATPTFLTPPQSPEIFFFLLLLLSNNNFNGLGPRGDEHESL